MWASIKLHFYKQNRKFFKKIAEYLYTTINALMLVLSAAVILSLFGVPVECTCLKKTSETQLEGNYYVIGLYSLMYNENFDEQAVRLHLSLRYFIGRQRQLAVKWNIRNVRIGFVAYDVCNDSLRLTEVLIKLFMDPMFNSNNCSVQKPSEDSCCLECDYSSNIIAVVSYLSPELTRQAADILQIEKLPYFAYSERVSLSRSQMTHHVNFISIYRLINDEVVKLLEVIRKGGFKTIALVQLEEKQSNISKLHQERLRHYIKSIGHLCYKATVINVHNKSNSRYLIDKIKKAESIDLIILWSSIVTRSETLKIIDEIKVQNRTWFWYSEESFNLTMHVNISCKTAENMYIINHPLYGYQYLLKYFSYTKMEIHLKRKYFLPILNDPWVGMFMSKYKIQVQQKNPFQRLDDSKTIENEYIDNVMLILWWSQPWRRLSLTSLKNYKKRLISVFAARRVSSLLSRLNHENKNTKIQRNTSKQVCQPSSIHDGVIPSTKSERNTHGGVCRPRPCFPGFQPVLEEHSLEEHSFPIWQRNYAWQCQRCPRGYYKRNYSTEKCDVCPEDQLPSANGSGCFDPYRNQYLRWGDEGSVAIILLLTCGVLFNLVALASFLMYNNTPVVRASNFRTSVFHLSLHLALYLCVPFLFIGEPNLERCISQSFVSGFFLTVIISITLKKIQQKLFAFEANRKLTRENIFMSSAVEVLVVSLLTLTQISMSVIYFIEQPPRVIFNVKKKLQASHEHHIRQISCNTQVHLDMQLIYIVLLSVFCLIQGFRARDLPKYFNETKYIALSMFLTITVIAFKYPIHQSASPCQKPMIDMLTIALINTSQLGSMYGYKVYKLLFVSKGIRNGFRVRMGTKNLVEQVGLEIYCS